VARAKHATPTPSTEAGELIAPVRSLTSKSGAREGITSEHGVADVRETVDEHAAALIAVAAPQFRNGLARAWADRQRRM
jgi:acyl-CoA hydrolase